MASADHDYYSVVATIIPLLFLTFAFNFRGVYSLEQVMSASTDHAIRNFVLVVAALATTIAGEMLSLDGLRGDPLSDFQDSALRLCLGFLTLLIVYAATLPFQIRLESHIGRHGETVTGAAWGLTAGLLFTLIWAT